ncbi:MAG: L-lysine 6-transaminase, partial [Planctomycetota bacterium]|nr:L-lysine 6-transaminase [Planctomycetota bacterium]
MKDRVDPYSVAPLLRKHLIGDGYDIVFDLGKSHGAWVSDARDGSEYLDFYTFFASLPLGFNHQVFSEEAA